MSSYGPSLPPHLAKKREEDEQEQSDSDDEQEQDVVGPALPPHLLKKRQEQQEKELEVEVEERLQPQVDSDDGEESDDDEVIGPMPPKPGEVACSSASADFEARARMMRDKIEEANRPKEHKRETWMLELPEENAKNFGLGPRQFSKSTKDKGKRDHSWTMTPEQKAKKSKNVEDDEEEVGAKGQDEDVLAYLASLKRDQEMDKVAKELKKKRGEETLMELHDKKLKKKRKEEETERKKQGKEVERRPFDRDLDLQANRFDNAQKELMLKKARQLNDKFSQGATKFL